MTAPNEITRIQDAYVEKVVDTLNDLPNVLWIVSEEAPANSTWWNDHHDCTPQGIRIKETVPASHWIRGTHPGSGYGHLQLGSGLGSAAGQNLSGSVMRQRAAALQGQCQ